MKLTKLFKRRPREDPEFKLCREQLEHAVNKMKDVNLNEEDEILIDTLVDLGTIKDKNNKSV